MESAGNGDENLSLIREDLRKTYCWTCKDVFKQDLADRGLTEPLRRLILIGKLKHADAKDVKRHHDEMAQRSIENTLDNSSKLTGLMVVDRSFFYHFVEGSEDVLHDVIDFTVQLLNKKLIIGAKVVRTSSLPFRFFDQWNSCIIFSVEDVDCPEPEPSASSTETDLTTLATKIKTLEDVVFVVASSVRGLKAPSDVESRINDLVPTSVLPFERELEELYGEPLCLTVERYFERYYEPVDYKSYVEREWPPNGNVADVGHFFEELEAFEEEVEEKLRIEEEQKRKKARYGTWWWA